MIPTTPPTDVTIKDIHQIPFNVFRKKNEKKRIITTTKKWSLLPQNINQFDIVKQLLSTISSKHEPEKPETQKDNDGASAAAIDRLIIQQIKQKLSSYKHQDQLKGIYNYDNSINSVENILSLLVQCQLTCFYCKNTVNVIYENVCEPSQWTLERIDNNLGHNYDNVCIACLKCNIGRRNMHQKRYLFTKKCTETVVILEDHYDQT
jgi:hypothetical protein